MPLKFGGAPKCQRCATAVYLAEQVVGPGGPYHKKCLTCKECKKSLDSFTLAESGGEAYCKVCHGRLFGPKGYGFGGGASFLHTETAMPADILKRAESESLENIRSNPADAAASSEIYKPLSVSEIASRVEETATRPSERSASSSDVSSKVTDASAGAAVAANGLPRRQSTNVSSSAERLTPSSSATTPPGTRKWTPTVSGDDRCPTCGKTVYAAESVLGGGKKFHKLCYKCSNCGKQLDSTNLAERDNRLYCRGCYSKNFGPKGYGFGKCDAMRFILFRHS